jgi:glycosyltransferase involved in cell wall biosynthesis
MSVCVITGEMLGPFKNGGIGTHCFNLAKFLSVGLGRKVKVLYTGEIEVENSDYWRRFFDHELGVEFCWIDPAHIELPWSTTGLTAPHDRMSQAVFQHLRSHPCDVCYFQEMLGFGFRTIQAKRTGLAFQKTVLTCMVHSSWQWICEAMKTQPSYGIPEMLTKYMERYCVEHCDILLSPSQYMLEWCKTDIPSLPTKKYVLPYLCEMGLEHIGHEPANCKVIFFGRLEARKGLLLFLEALAILARRRGKDRPPLRVVFLGKDGYTPDGCSAVTIDGYREILGSQATLEVINNLGQQEAIAYLKKNRDAVVACPSLIDNSPHTIIECLELGVNLIACKSGGIPELFADDERLAEPDPDSLANLLGRALDNQLGPVVKRYSPERSRTEWRSFVETVDRELPSLCGATFSTETVATGVSILLGDASVNPVYDLAIEALGAQTLGEFRLCTIGANTSPNIPPEIADSETLIVVPPNTIPDRSMVAELLTALQASGCRMVTAWSRLDSRDQNSGTDRGLVYAPFGPCFEGSLHGNLLGIGPLAIRLASIVHFGTLAHYARRSDVAWSTLLHLTVNQLETDVVPAILSNAAMDCSELVASRCNYDEHISAIAELTQGLPRWMSRVLMNASALELQVRDVTQQCDSLRRNMAKLKSKVDLIHKAPYEYLARTVLSKAKRLFRPITFDPRSEEDDTLRTVGLDSDGWARQRVSLEVPPGIGVRRLRISGDFPNWLGISSNTVEFSVNSAFVQKMHIVPGDFSLTIKIPKTKGSKMITFTCGKAARLPAPDTRNVALYIKKINIFGK